MSTRALIATVGFLSIAVSACSQGASGDGSPTYVPPQCTGTAIPCALLDEASCGASVGCFSDGICGGVTPACALKTTSTSCISLGCSWSALDQQCTGIPRACASNIAHASCELQPGCYWSASCSGFAADCGFVPLENCELQPGCHLVGDLDAGPDSAIGTGGSAGQAGSAGAGGLSDAGDSEACPVTCDGTCVDIDTDSSNCGSCGHACSSLQSCHAGACKCKASALEACGTKCVDTSSDVKNCGACDNVCEPGEACQAGACVCASNLHCGGACTPVNDPKNCGGCGVACDLSHKCTSGHCTCYSGETDCGGVCVFLDDDEKNCGKCGVTCHSGEVCTSGLCLCPDYLMKWCPNVGTCVDTHDDEQNCGTCGNACPSGTFCLNSECACSGTKTLCGTVCIDTHSDVANCGGCAIACPAHYNCDYGSCRCPTPVAGTPVRLTNSVADSGWVSVASDGKHVGVVYVERTSYHSGALMFAVLNPDGTRAMPNDMTLVSGNDLRVVEPPRIIWNGQEYVVFYTSYQYSYDLTIARLGPMGEYKGGAVTIANSFDSFKGLSITWSPAYGGYAVGFTQKGQVGFRRLAGSSTPADTATNWTSVQLQGYPTDSTAIAALPDGTWEVLARVLRYAYLLKFNADGSRTLPVSTLQMADASADSQAVWDGASVLKGWISDTSYDASVRVTRSAASGYDLAKVSSTGMAGNMGALQFALDGAGTVAIGWTQRSQPGSYSYRVARYTVPPAAGAKLTSLSDTATILSTANVPPDEPVGLAPVGPHSLLAVWPDDRWGTAAELYAEPLDLQGCP